jgi:lysophospholipase L1-like esterase
VELRVLGRSGARLADVVSQQAPQVAALPPDQSPDLVFVSVGANDVTHLTGNNAFRSDYLGLLDLLPSSASVIALGVPDMGSVPRFAQPLRALAGWRGGTLDWDVEQMRDNGADYVNIADFTGPAFGADPDRYFAADGFHPNDEGYRLWADTVVPVARWRLYKRDHPTAEEPLQPKEAKGTVKGAAP